MLYNSPTRRRLGRLARLSGYGGYGAAPRFPLWPGSRFGFNNAWAAEWYAPGSAEHRHAQFWKLGDWSYPSSTVFKLAAEKELEFARAADAANLKAEQVFESVALEIDRLTKAADSNVQGNWDSITVVAPDSARKNLYSTYDAITRAIKKLVNTAVPAPEYVVTNVQPPGGSGATTTVSPPVNIVAPHTEPYSPPGTQSYRPPAASQQSMITAGAGLPSWVMPVGVGVGTLLFGGILYAATRKKKG